MNIFNHGSREKNIINLASFSAFSGLENSQGRGKIVNRESREKREKILDGLNSGIVKELLELREMIG